MSRNSVQSFVIENCNRSTIENGLNNVCLIAPAVPYLYLYHVSAGERLTVTLRYLASGDSQKTIAIEFRLKTSAVNEIIRKTCEIIWEKLSPKFVKFPSLEKWKDNADDFGKFWNHSHGLGAIDGKHIAIKTPQNSGSDYFNYKGFSSFVLRAILEAKYRFAM